MPTPTPGSGPRAYLAEPGPLANDMCGAGGASIFFVARAATGHISLCKKHAQPRMRIANQGRRIGDYHCTKKDIHIFPRVFFARFEGAIVCSSEFWHEGGDIHQEAFQARIQLMTLDQQSIPCSQNPVAMPTNGVVQTCVPHTSRPVVLFTLMILTAGRFLMTG